MNNCQELIEMFLKSDHGSNPQFKVFFRYGYEVPNQLGYYNNEHCIFNKINFDTLKNSGKIDDIETYHDTVYNNDKERVIVAHQVFKLNSTSE